MGIVRKLMLYMNLGHPSIKGTREFTFTRVILTL